MKSKLNGKPTAPVAKGAGKPPTSTGGSYAPSVPISLYREVVTELQSTRASLESLQAQNQELFQHNQKLRIEIERVVQSALQLRQAADASRAEPLNPAGVFSLADLEVRPDTPKPTGQSLPLDPFPPRMDAPEGLHPGQAVATHRAVAAETTGEVNGWWLALVVFLIIVSAFGVGFVIVRPLLPNR